VVERTRLLLRPEARRPELWRGRWVFGLFFSGAGLWSAVAPQINFSLGERLQLAFETMATLAVAMALLAGLRYVPRADRYANARLPEAAVQFLRGANDLILLIPILLFLVALQSVSKQEFLTSFSMITLALLASTAVSNFQGPTILFPIVCAVLVAMQKRSPFESVLILLYAAHLYFKARVAFGIFSPEQITSAELCELRRRSFRKPLFALALINIAVLCLANFWPIKLEEKLPLGLILVFGIVSLFLDSFALTWRGMLNRSPLSSLVIVVGVPWAAAWAFAALHTGEAFTMNEGAAYFFLWVPLGSALSWLTGNAAKQEALQSYREAA
jgi:hypothetical protein